MQQRTACIVSACSLRQGMHSNSRLFATILHADIMSENALQQQTVYKILHAHYVRGYTAAANCLLNSACSLCQDMQCSSRLVKSFCMLTMLGHTLQQQTADRFCTIIVSGHALQQQTVCNVAACSQGQGMHCGRNLTRSFCMLTTSRHTLPSQTGYKFLHDRCHRACLAAAGYS